MEVNALLKLKIVEWPQLILPSGVGPLSIHEIKKKGFYLSSIDIWAALFFVVG